MSVPMTIRSAAFRMSFGRVSLSSAWNRFIRRIGAMRPCRQLTPKCKTRVFKPSFNTTSSLLPSENTVIPYLYATVRRQLSLWLERRELPDCWPLQKCLHRKWIRASLSFTLLVVLFSSGDTCEQLNSSGRMNFTGLLVEIARAI